MSRYRGEGVVPRLDDILNRGNLSIKVDAGDGPSLGHSGPNRLWLYAKKEIPLIVLRGIVMGYLQEQCGLDVEFSEDPTLVAMASSLINPQAAKGAIHDRGDVSRGGLAFAVITYEDAWGRIDTRKYTNGNSIQFYALREDILQHMMNAHIDLRRRFKL